MKKIIRMATLVVLLFIGACSTNSRLSNKSGSSNAADWTWEKPSPMATAHGKGKPHYKIGRPYVVKGRTYYPQERFSHVETGIASWYGPGFHGRLTANGEIFDENKPTAAHKSLQLPCLVKVTNLGNGHTAIVRVNDRGPYHADRVIDLSKAAARTLGFHTKGTARVRIEVLKQESLLLANLAKQGRFPETLPAVVEQPYRGPVRLVHKPAHIEGRPIRLAHENYALKISGIQSPQKALEYHGELSKVARPIGIKEDTTAGQRHFALHVGAFATEDEAIKMATHLHDLGHRPEVVVNSG